MKTSLRIRILSLSLVALTAFGFASKTFAAVNMYLEITAEDGKITKVDVAKDGSFTSPALSAGRVKVQFHWDRSPGKSAGAVDNAPVIDGRGLTPDDQNRRNDKIEAFVFHYEIISPRDPATGHPSGKRQHAPPLIFKVSSSERLLPTVNKKFGTIAIDEPGVQITGKIEMQDGIGKTVAVDDWTVPSK